MVTSAKGFIMKKNLKKEEYFTQKELAAGMELLKTMILSSNINTPVAEKMKEAAKNVK